LKIRPPFKDGRRSGQGDDALTDAEDLAATP
jgi:hypothetical protein